MYTDYSAIEFALVAISLMAVAGIVIGIAYLSSHSVAAVKVSRQQSQR